MRVPYGADLDRHQRIALARISGRVQRLAFGALRDWRLVEKVAALHEETRDRAVLGIALGAAMASVELEGLPNFAAVVELLRAAGADEQVAAAHFEWQRDRLRRMSGATKYL